MKKINAIIIGLGLSLPSMAQQKFELGKPNDDNYRYLDEYADLKEYINRDKYPNFRMGLATIVSDYLNNTTMRNLINRNANETVAGNAMKMASCVDGNGNMNFTNVTRFVNTATTAGIEVYGHTLAWHSQQPKGWLLKLLKDRPAPELTEGDTTVYTSVYTKDFRTNQSVGWKSDETTYGYSLTFDASNGLNIHCTKKVNSWEVQFLACTDILTDAGKTYRMTMTVKGSKAGKLHTKLGDWNGGAGGDVAFTTEWKEVTFNYKATMSNNFYLLQCGDFVGDIYIKDIKFEIPKKAQIIEEDRRYLMVKATERQDETWDNQAWLVPGSFSAGAKFEFSADVRADKAATATTQIHNAPSDYVHYEAIGNIPFTTEWKTVTLSGTLSKAGKSIALNLSELADANNYYFDNVSLKINGVERIKNGDFEGTDVSSFKVKTNRGSVTDPEISEGLRYVYLPTSIPLTPEERHDTLVYAMDKWIKGMMNACGGKVKAWDLVNEAISGGGDDGSGNYTLQHSEGYNPNGTWDVGGDAFYWQDYMGDLEYVRQACRLARKYGPEDVKLFINDYNLESFWDNNKKLRSLINWIKKWEADGVTKIDGIGTQMHISCSMNDNTLNDRKKYITQMFKLMAATGKYVRVSELDMGMDDVNGNAVSTGNMTEAMHKRMASYYEWIIKQYLTLVPAKQQWGICQWCPTDSPSNSGWRADTPVGIWDINCYRKHVYAGWVRGFGGIPNDIEEVGAEDNATTTIIYDIQGKRIANQADFSSLPAGLYIVNGKKVSKR
ncbi:MAG: endo-1,4-beta-xylanase [Bacteroidales bacterium]|nr:endo-1,4-beta-xylanase [Bacteroidales bacterium]